MTEIGKIEKPEVESFSGQKKLYFVRNIYLTEKVPDEYRQLFHRYWDEVTDQLEKVEAAGKVSKIFCETIASSDEESLKTLERMNDRAVQFIRTRIEHGAELVPLEKDEIFGPFLDWSNCLMVVRTYEVFGKVLEFYNELLEKRSQHIIDVFQKSLSAGEAGLLIMRDEDRVKLQFPKDIELFLVTPPSYDDILKWLRKQMQKQSAVKDENGKEQGG
jgi:hypothetical protein